ncbi:flagellar basal body rod protein FlgB [Bacillus marasmi]|uniref:flagellar basal body rod protein FlgB n=1 Tax=Bacillus marasmi TaxID=1926279 RepID=UPI0011CBFF1C|nr:flagellar basal body rod protein FlgB [Bacillus marasmi]
MDNISLLKSALDASSMRQQVISQNIANAETPGYKAKQVAFENILKKHLSDQTSFVGTKTDSRHVTIGRGSAIPAPQMVENTEAFINNNGNSVDMDYEMTEMGKNSLWYYMLTERVSGHFNNLSYAIKGRG